MLLKSLVIFCKIFCVKQYNNIAYGTILRKACFHDHHPVLYIYIYIYIYIHICVCVCVNPIMLNHLRFLHKQCLKTKGVDIKGFTSIIIGIDCCLGFLKLQNGKCIVLLKLTFKNHWGTEQHKVFDGQKLFMNYAPILE